MSQPPVCVKCRQEGIATDATHRLVARGHVEEKDSKGDHLQVHVDMPEVAVCERHAEAIMRARPREQARMKIAIIAALQEKAQAEGKHFAPTGAYGGTFDYGFADLWKPLFIVSAEMAQGVGFNHAAPPREGEG